MRTWSTPYMSNEMYVEDGARGGECPFYKGSCILHGERWNQKSMIWYQHICNKLKLNFGPLFPRSIRRKQRNEQQNGARGCPQPTILKFPYPINLMVRMSTSGLFTDKTEMSFPCCNPFSVCPLY